MRNFFNLTVLFVSVLFLASCSSDDNGSNNNEEGVSLGEFVVDGNIYKLHQATLLFVNDLSTGKSNTSISLGGVKGTDSTMITFSLFHNTSDGAAGAYVSNENSWDEIVGTYSSLLSSCVVNQNMTNHPVGPVKVISHGNNEYTLEFNVTYSNNVKASGNVKTKFTVQTTEF